MDLLFQAQNITTNLVIENSLNTQNAISGLLIIKSEIEKLSEQTWDILNVMSEIDRKEEVLGTLRLFLIEVEEELERILELSSIYPEFAAAILDELMAMFIDNNVSIDKFKRMKSVDDIKWAKKIIREVNEYHTESVIQRSRDENLQLRYTLLKESIANITDLELEINSLIPDLLSSDLCVLSKEEFVQNNDYLNQLYAEKAKLEVHLFELAKKITPIREKYDSEISKIPSYYPESTVSNLKSPIEKKMHSEIEDIVRQYNLDNDLKIDFDVFMSSGVHYIQKEITQTIADLNSDYENARGAIEKAWQQHNENSLKIEQLERNLEKNWEAIENLIPDQRVDAKSLSNITQIKQEVLNQN